MIHERKFPALVIRYVEAAVEKPAKIRSPGQDLGLPVGVRSLVEEES